MQIWIIKKYYLENEITKKINYQKLIYLFFDIYFMFLNKYFNQNKNRIYNLEDIFGFVHDVVRVYFIKWLYNSLSGIRWEIKLPRINCANNPSHLCFSSLIILYSIWVYFKYICWNNEIRRQAILQGLVEFHNIWRIQQNLELTCTFVSV